MGGIVTFYRVGSCPHLVVRADRESYREKSQRLAACIACGKEVSWEEIAADYEERP